MKPACYASTNTYKYTFINMSASCESYHKIKIIL